MPLAALRPDQVDFPLFLHVLGAAVLVGSLFTAALALVLAGRRAAPSDAVALERLGLRTFFVGVLPAYVVMRIGAQWAESRENLTEEQEEAAWLGIGYVTADIGALLILVSLVLSGIGLRRLGTESAGRSGLSRIVGVAAVLLLVAYVVTAWVMTTKPD